MIIKDKTNKKIEDLKFRLKLTGDVYIVGQNYIENLESHKKLFPQSKAITIEEAEQERINYIEIEKQKDQEQPVITEVDDDYKILKRLEDKEFE